MRTCCTVVAQEHDLCATPVQCNATQTLSSHFALRSSHPALQTSHLHFTLRTSSQLISSELFSSHFMSFHCNALAMAHENWAALPQPIPQLLHLVRFYIMYLVTTSLRHHFCKSPLPLATTSPSHYFPWSPLPLVTAFCKSATSLCHHFPWPPFPLATTSLIIVTASLSHHFP